MLPSAGKKENPSYIFELQSKNIKKDFPCKQNVKSIEEGRLILLVQNTSDLKKLVKSQEKDPQKEEGKSNQINGYR